MDERIKEMISMIESGNVSGFLDDIDQIAASKAYLIIRDHIKQNHIKVIRESGKENYQKFQDIKLRAKQSWDYDHKTATIEDVNRACVNLYTIVLRLIKAQGDGMAEEFDRIKPIINKIEEKVGLDVTSWDNESDTDNGGDNNDGNVQGVKEDI